MRRGFLGFAAALFLLNGGVAAVQPAAVPARQQTASAAGSTAAAQYRAVLDRYCVSCHNDRLQAGSLSLHGLDLSRVPQDADVWERVVRKMTAGAMPPAGSQRPDAQTTAALVTYLSTTLDREAVAHPKPGR